MADSTSQSSIETLEADTFEAEHAGLIARERQMLEDNLEQARVALTAAIMSVLKLMSNEIYDVEYAEDPGGTYVSHFLHKAQADLAAARSLAKDIHRLDQGEG